ncbi:MAG: enoyl-CoA hydratase/isomerase family protein [candidate division FCPU426 bacterium]
MAVTAYEVDSGAAVVTLTNGAAGNVLNHESLGSLQAALNRAASDPDVRVVVLRAEGDSFCLGMDLSLVRAGAADPGLAKETVGQYTALLAAIQDSAKPVVAVVHGAVKAGGIGLAGACDIVLASEGATFEFSEVILGLIPANVIPFLAGARVPAQVLKYLILTAKRLDAAEALAVNLVDEVFSQAQLAAGAKAVVKTLLRASPRALAEAKRFFSQLARQTREEASAKAQAKLLELIQDPEVLAAIQAFEDGLTPSWFSKYQPKHPLAPQGGS